MKKINGTQKKIVFGIVTAILVAGGALTCGFQGVLASLGVLSLIMIAVFGLYAAKRARLYSKALKFAEAQHEPEDTPLSGKDAKWILKHLDELYRVEENEETAFEAPVSAGDRKCIMTHIDELFTDRREEGNIVTRTDKKLIMDNVDRLFFDEWEQDRQPFSW